MEQKRKGEYRRQLIYFSSYKEREKAERAGYAAIFIKNELCEVQIYYRGREDEEVVVQPVYVFRDGSAVEGEEIATAEGMAVTGFETATENFLRTGRNINCLEAIYLEGTGLGICGGRADGQALFGEDTYSVTKWMDTVTEIVTEQDKELKGETLVKLQETWSLGEYMERLPELKLPFDGMRRQCCRMTLADMEHMPKEWRFLRDNHFLLHGYYEYHHLLFGKLCGRYGERFVIGVPGEYGAREQYMAESFGFSDFAPLEQGKKHRGSFGYWYFYLTRAAY